jgi:signal transduction histidine kinase
VKALWGTIKRLIDRYPILFIGLLIYVHYLFTSFNLFKHIAEKRSFFDYILQFDSLFFMWLAAFAFSQFKKIQKSYREEKERLHNIERALDQQQISHQIINDITSLLQDSVNNPLAVISLTTQEIRKKFEGDSDIIRGLERIESAMNRIHGTVRDLKAYEEQKIIEATSKSVGTDKAGNR